MNHLAHVLLAGADEEMRLGGMLGDFVQGTLDGSPLPPRVVAGIRLHRAIDVFTDAHPEVLEAKATLPPPYRRYAGILLDMWFDHCLARDFSRWSDEPLSLFSQGMQDLLARHDASLPDGLRRFAGYMRLNNLPAAYADRVVLGQALAGIGQRLRRTNPLASSLPLLRARERELQARFDAFFPALRQFSRDWRQQHGYAGG